LSEGLEAVLALVPVSDGAKAELRAKLAGADRHYHGTAHVALLWERHLRFGGGLSVQEASWHQWLACAIAYHDAIYDAARKDNEARSAVMWQDAKPALPWEGIAWVTGTILATANHLAAVPEEGMGEAAWAARVWMLDLDLTPLGEVPPVFDANTAALRREFGHLSDEAWVAGRGAFLRGISKTERLFRTPVLHAAFEGAARANFARELGVG
jgi:predicted metal-dependent HD superfamily phosphohydrolase